MDIELDCGAIVGMITAGDDEPADGSIDCISEGIGISEWTWDIDIADVDGNNAAQSYGCWAVICNVVRAAGVVGVAIGQDLILEDLT